MVSFDKAQPLEQEHAANTATCYTVIFFLKSIDKSKNPTQGKFYVSSKMFSDKFLVSLASEHHLGPLQGERQLLAGAVSARCCAGVKPNLPPGGRSHYSKELSEKAGHELQTPSDEPDGERGAWRGVKPEPGSHCMAQQTPKTKANKIKEPTAL